MKTFLLVGVSLICSCRSLPVDTFVYETSQKNDHYRYEVDASDKYNKILKSEVQKVLKTNGSKLATVKIKDQSKCYDRDGDVVLYFIPSVVTLGVLNFVGWPFERITAETALQADVYDLSGKKIKSYYSQKEDWSVVAMYYGFGAEDVNTRALSNAYKKALDDVLTQINTDDALYQSLKAKEVQKQKHLKNVMSELSNL